MSDPQAAGRTGTLAAEAAYPHLAKSPPGWATACVLLSALGFGSLALWVKLGFRAGLDPLSLLAARFALAAPILLAACAARDRTALARPPREVARLLAMGAAGYGTPSLLAFLALRITDGAVFSALYFTFPLWVALGTSLLFREPLGARRAAALALAVGGAALAAGLLDGPRGGRPPAGLVLSLGAALSYSTYVLAGQRVLARTDPLAVAGYSMLGCALLFLVLRLAAGGPPPPLVPLLEAAALMSVAATAAPLALLMIGMRRLGAARTAVVGAAEPVFTAGLLALTLGERVSASQALGILAIVAGVALVSAARPAPPAGAPDCP